MISSHIVSKIINIVSKTSVKIVFERQPKSKTDETKRLQNFKIGAIWVGTMSLVPQTAPQNWERFG